MYYNKKPFKRYVTLPRGIVVVVVVVLQEH